MSQQESNYKDPKWAVMWLDTALEKEEEKYARCPLNHNEMVSGHIAAEAWGYVVAGYSLLELSFKAQLHVLGNEVPQIHPLLDLFKKLRDFDQDTLREYYDDLLGNLDGDTGRGSFDWRYFPIEEERSQQMPVVGIGFLHEITYGSNRIVEYHCNGKWDPRQYTHSKGRSRSRQVASSTTPA